MTGLNGSSCAIPWFCRMILFSAVLFAAPVQASPEVGPTDLPEGYFLVEGDIVVGADFFQRATYKRFDHWTDGIVYFEFDSNVSDSRRTAMREAMDEWMDVSGVVFLPRSGQTNYIHIVHSDGNASEVGMVGGEQWVWIVSWDNRFIMAHELCHTLAFWHEQSRPDRDDYVQINWQNIQQDYENNFDMEGGAGTVGDYDFDSVMHYGECAFSTNPWCPLGGGQTITVLPPNEEWQGQIGQRDHFSANDIAGMRLLYGEGEVVFVDHTYTAEDQAGTLARPYQHFTDGAAAVPSGGTVWIRGGSHSATGTYSRVMKLRAYSGTVSLGE